MMWVLWFGSISAAATFGYVLRAMMEGFGDE